jgi:type II secretory pathway pseudopilin PulG
MSLKEQISNKIRNRNMKEAFKNEAGAIDLASIMVGIIVIGLIGGVIAATVFAVIPWAQDNAAKQQLDSVVSAQSAFLGLSADGPIANVTPANTINTYGTKVQLASAGLLSSTAPVSIVVGTDATGPHYGAVVKSASGGYFGISDVKTQPTTKKANVTGAKIDGGFPVTGATWDSTVLPSKHNAILKTKETICLSLLTQKLKPLAVT